MTNWKTRFNPHEWKTNSRDKDSSLLISVIHSSALSISLCVCINCLVGSAYSVALQSCWRFITCKSHTHTNKFENKKIKLSLPRQVLPIDFSAFVTVVKNWSDLFMNDDDKKNNNNTTVVFSTSVCIFMRGFHRSFFVFNLHLAVMFEWQTFSLVYFPNFR